MFARAYLIGCVLSVLLLLGCAEEETLLLECDQVVFQACGDDIDGDYCLFGLKWGETTSFNTRGANAPGPEESGGLITYSFFTDSLLIRIHNNDELRTFSIDEKGRCIRSEIDSALTEYAGVAAVEFNRLPDNSAVADLKFYASENESLSVGYCNYQTTPCSELRGRVVFNRNTITNCDDFRVLALHEIGHALGLGHVNTDNVMGLNFRRMGFRALQEGDIQGIQALYGVD